MPFSALRSSLFTLKSMMLEEFFVTFLYSDCNKYLVAENILGLAVKSALSEITWKYGVLTDAHRNYTSKKLGFKKPDCLLTLGSG